MRLYKNIYIDFLMIIFMMQIAYHGIPDKAYEVFLEANQAKGRKMDSSKNPAGENIV